jgi:hypothetical protein
MPDIIVISGAKFKIIYRVSEKMWPAGLSGGWLAAYKIALAKCLEFW